MKCFLIYICTVNERKTLLLFPTPADRTLATALDAMGQCKGCMRSGAAVRRSFHLIVANTKTDRMKNTTGAILHFIRFAFFFFTDLSVRPEKGFADRSPTASPLIL